MQVQKLVNEAEDLVTIKEGLVEEAGRKELALAKKEQKGGEGNQQEKEVVASRLDKGVEMKQWQQ